MSVEELRRIAAEAGIDPGATDSAIQEFFSNEEPVPVPATPTTTDVPSRTSKSPSQLGIVVSSAVGLALGFMIAVGPATAGPLSIGAAVIYLILRAVQSMKRGAQLDFQLQNLALWFGAAVGALATVLG